MKKLLAIFAAIAALLACSKVEELSTPDIAEVQNSEITFNINVGDLEPQTKAIKTDWENGDVINFWFNDDIQEVPDLKMTYSNGKWTYGNLREGAYFNESGYIKAIYESFNDLSKYSYSNGYFYTTTNSRVRHPMVLYTSRHTYTCSSKTVTADISDKWVVSSKIQIVVTGLDGDKAESYVLHCPQLRPLKGFGLNEYNAVGSRGESGSYVAGVKNADGVAFYFYDNMNTTTGEYYDDFYFTLYEYSSSGKLVSEKNYDVEGKSLTPTTQKCQGIKIDGRKFIVPPKVVDLGLPSGLLWATFNVGASKPEEHGDYYAWGETQTKTNYSWSTYLDNPSGDGLTFIKYRRKGDKTVLDPEDDVASVRWGGKWRIPTDMEWDELLEKCSWSWTNNYNSTGVAGIIVTSKKSGYTDKSIFLPAAGYVDGERLVDVSDGFYWSSTFDSSSFRQAWSARFLSLDFNMSRAYPCLGQPVRPVYGDRVPPLPEGALRGKFSVSSTKKIHFSKGNLFATVNASGVPTAWGFQTAQYDYIGFAGANGKIGTAAGDVDLFGWSTPATRYGINTSTSFSTYSGDFKDWGTTIDSKGTWRTLSKGEWEYLLNTRTSAKDKWGYTEIDDAANGRTYRGLILLPDDWTKPTSCSFTSGRDNGWKTNSYTMSQWSAMEKSGAVLLPLPGYRDGNYLGTMGSIGYYWSSSAGGEATAYLMTFGCDTETYYYPGSSIATRDFGRSVRLVTDAF